MSVNCSSTFAARVRRSPDSPTQQLMMSLSTLSWRKGFFAFSSWDTIADHLYKITRDEEDGDTSGGESTMMESLSTVLITTSHMKTNDQIILSSHKITKFRSKFLAYKSRKSWSEKRKNEKTFFYFFRHTVLYTVRCTYRNHWFRRHKMISRQFHFAWARQHILAKRFARLIFDVTGDDCRTLYELRTLSKSL